MGGKAAETTHNINNAFGLGTANKHAVQWWFEKLCKQDKPWRWRAQWPTIRSWQWPTERIVKADPVKTTWEVAEELNIDRSMVIWHLKQTGKMKKLYNWVPHELTENKKMSF